MVYGDLKRMGNVYSVDFKPPRRINRGGVSAVVRRLSVAETTRMERPSVYQYKETNVPGANVHRLRLSLGWSQRQLADKCHPALDHTTIRRLEHNSGYTQDTLERVAVALGVKVPDLFLPCELIDWPELANAAKNRIGETIQDAVAAQNARKKIAIK